MDDPDQSPLVSSSSPSAGGPERWQPQQPLFQYQFVKEPEEEEEEDEEEEEEEEEDDERLEVRERKPVEAPTTFAAPSPPLLDMAVSGERSPSAPQPAWTGPPSPPTAPEEPPRTVPPPREEPPAPAVPPRSAPPPPPKREEPLRKVSASGSPDETLFALPVASEPLMHSPSDKGMDWQEQLSRVHLANQEDSAAVLLDATASLPSLSPLSVNPFKEHADLDTISDGISSKGSYGHVEIEAFKATSKNARNPFLVEDDGDAPKLQYSGSARLYSGTELFSLSQPEAAVETKIKSCTEKFPVNQQDSSPDSPVELFSKQDKDSFIEDMKYVDDYSEKVALEDNHNEYVDFKPFESTWTVNENSGLKDSVKNQSDCKLESGIYKYDSEKGKTPPVQKGFEKDSESSNEDISFPSTPETSKEPSLTYITCDKSAETIESNVIKSLPLVEEQTSVNKTDEKKIAEMKAHFGTEQGGVQAELASGMVQKADFDKAESLLTTSSDALANMPEGLTPDLVQEAYESELHDAVSPKLAYEPQIDLVQTSELLQEPLNAGVQLCPSFEGGTETAPSPVLPDIVMEAPLNASSAGVGGPAVPLEVSSESFTAATATDDYENVMEKSEKPPSYQETMNVLATQVQEPKVEITSKEPGSLNGTIQDLENSYISIACDLVKETKVSNESSSPAFTDYSKTVLKECASQPVPDIPERPEKVLSATLSGKSDLFDSWPEPHLVQKESEDVKEKPLEIAPKFVPEEGQREKSEELQHPISKPYLESFQPHLEPFKDVPAGWSPEVEATDLAKKQKTPHMYMEEFSTYSDDFNISKDHQTWNKNVLSAESSPETDDFPKISYQDTKYVTGVSEKGTLKKDESSEILGSVKTELRQSPYQEVAEDLSLKNIHVRIEEQDLPLEKSSEKLDREVLETAKAPPLPADSIGKKVSIEKEAERGVKEKEKLSPMFSRKLNKPSVVDLLYWRDVKKTGVVFGASLFLLLSLTVFSIVSVVAYIALLLLSVTICFRIYKGVIQAIQKSDDGHPFRAYLDKDVAVSEELVQKYSHVVLGHINNTVKELRRLFLVDDMVDSLKFAVLMWVFTYVGALFNGLTLLILVLMSLFSVPIIYEKHQNVSSFGWVLPRVTRIIPDPLLLPLIIAKKRELKQLLLFKCLYDEPNLSQITTLKAQIDHYLGLVNKNVKDAVAKIQAKIPGLKRKAE